MGLVGDGRRVDDEAYCAGVFIVGMKRPPPDEWLPDRVLQRWGRKGGERFRRNGVQLKKSSVTEWTNGELRCKVLLAKT